MSRRNLRIDATILACSIGVEVLDWWIDRKPWERVYGIARAAVITVAALAVLFLGGCKTSDTTPGTGTEPSAVRVGSNGAGATA